MRRDRPNTFGALVGMACAAAFAFQAFTFEVDAETSSEISQMQSVQMPTARDLTVFERRLRKASRDSRFAATCGRGQLMGGTEVVVAMQFPPMGGSATAESPGYAQAHINAAKGKPKALIVESKYPTLWSVTGDPDAIIVLGKAVVAEYPEGTLVFAPRFVAACGGADWTHPPSNWSFPDQSAMMTQLIDDVQKRFNGRAQFVANRLFQKPAANWRVERGDVMMTF